METQIEESVSNTQFGFSKIMVGTCGVFTG